MCASNAVRRIGRSRTVAGMTLALVAASCQHAQPNDGYRTALSRSSHSPEELAALNQRGVSLATNHDYDAAEKAFRRVLAADISHAAAHNNLGLVLQGQGHYYESALEFTFAADLDKVATEPLINLGRLYESVGWSHEAVTAYEQAVARDGQSAEALGRLARAYVRAGKSPEKLRPILLALSTLHSEGDWRRWALARLDTAGDQPSDDIGRAMKANAMKSNE